MTETLVGLVVAAYVVAALGFAGELRGPGTAGRVATWAVRFGWLGHLALVGAQGVSAHGFAWASWPGAVNLLSWLVVTGFLGWGCTPRYRLLGLVVMPLAAALLAAGWAGGGTLVERRESDGALLATHTALMLAAIAGFTLASGMAVLFLWEERRLKRRDSRLMRLRVPPLEALDRLSARVSTVSLVLLTLGIGVGLASFGRGDFDAAMAVTVGAWLVYTTSLVLRREAGLRGRRMAGLLLAGFAALVLVLPITHFAP
ncbi:MAG: hypothetical protein EXQ77_05210 [Thermoleophilia bacterium]|nr:hypothetical protein [Thermoleophilia bacterium]